MTRPDPTTHRCRGDRGAASSLTLVLLTPVLVVLAFAAFQAALWSHARTEARVIARDTAALVARAGVPGTDARDAALAVLHADTDLSDVDVDVRTDADVVAVTITGSAPGIVWGTSARVEITVALPVERWTP